MMEDSDKLTTVKAFIHNGWKKNREKLSHLNFEKQENFK